MPIVQQHRHAQRPARTLERAHQRNADMDRRCVDLKIDKEAGQWQQTRQSLLEVDTIGARGGG